jgi:hypothetical protein
MKYEMQDHAQYNKIVMGVQNCEYLVEVKLNPVAFSDESLPMFTTVKVESVNPSAEYRRLVNRTSVGMRTDFSDLEARLRQAVQSFSNGNAMNAAGVPYLLSQTRQQHPCKHRLEHRSEKQSSRIVQMNITSTEECLGNKSTNSFFFFFPLSSHSY